MPNRIEMFRRLERQYFRDRLGTLGLQQLDGMILHLLGREGHMRQEDLAVQLAVDKGAVARSLARLEKRGLVERQVSARCRREKHVSLTPAGASFSPWQSQLGDTSITRDTWKQGRPSTTALVYSAIL